MNRLAPLLLWAVLTAAAQPDLPVSGARSAAGALEHEKTDDRIRALEKSLGRTPDDARITAELASAYLQKLRETADFHYLDLASKLADRMLGQEGGDAQALRFENEIDLQRHDFRAVAARSRDMIRYNRSDPGIWGNLGDALMELGEYDAARDAYLTMFGLRPDLASYNRLAYMRFVTGDAGGGIALMKQAIEAGSPIPENVAWCRAELGDMYFKTGRADDAGIAYRSALELFPGLHRASAGLGRVAAARGDTEDAIRNYRRAQSIVPLVEYAGALEDLYTKAGMNKEADEQKQTIDAIAKLGAATNEKTNRNLALVLADHDRNTDLALRLVQAEIKDRPDVYTWDALAWVLFKGGRLAEAREADVKALRLGTPEPLFYRHAAGIARASLGVEPRINK